MTTPTAPAVSAGKASIQYLYLITLVAAVGGFLFGYDLSLISGAIIFLKAEWSLSPFWMGAVAGSAILGCPFGPLVGAWLADAAGDEGQDLGGNRRALAALGKEIESSEP